MKKINTCVQEKKGAINVVLVVKGSDFFTLALSTQGEGLYPPGHHFEPLTIQTYSLLKEGNTIRLISHPSEVRLGLGT